MTRHPAPLSVKVSVRNQHLRNPEANGWPSFALSSEWEQDVTRNNHGILTAKTRVRAWSRGGFCSRLGTSK
jgi:hypothetical protein